VLTFPSSESLGARIRFAIAHKHLLEIRYNNGLRLVEPHDYGVLKGLERLLVYQLGGPARPSNRTVVGWRLFDVSKIEDCGVLEKNFRGRRSHPQQRHQRWDTVYARVR
jgi:hypothetical protein